MLYYVKPFAPDLPLSGQLALHFVGGDFGLYDYSRSAKAGSTKGAMQMQAITASWQFWAVLSAIFAALTAILAKLGVSGINPDLATFIRTLVVAAALAFLLAITGQFTSSGPISRKAIMFLALSGLATGASWICYFRALNIGQVAQVAPVDKLSVVLVALLGVFLLGEHLSLRGWLGICLITAGVVLLAIRA